MVVANDLTRTEDGQVVVGPETRKVCDAAYRLWRLCDGNAIVCATAGWSPNYLVFMGQEPMRTYLQSLGIPTGYIETPAAQEFNTNGEMEALSALMRKMEAEDPSFEYHFTAELICRDFHIWPRAALLLRARLGKLRARTRIHLVPVAVSKPWLALLHEVLAIPRNIFNFF